MLQDIRFALRTLIKSRSFTIAAVLCLALGIGANATIFSCVRALLLRPFPYRDPDELVAIGESSPLRGWHMNTVSYPNFRSWQAENRTLANIGIYTDASFNLATDEAAVYVPGANVSWTMFGTLGVAPAIGRDFREDEDRVGAPKVAILSDQLWHDRFGGRMDALSQQVMIDGVPHTVIGVMPPGFAFPDAASVWTTMQRDALAARGNHSWNVIGRAKPHVTLDQVQQDLRAVASRLEPLYPESNSGWSAEAETLRDFQAGDWRSGLMIMMAAVALVLLIACANVANLLLARGAVRSKEIAVRVALGANRWRVVRQLLTESILVAIAGATFGVVFAYAFLQWIKANLVGIPFWMHFTIDSQVLLFTAVVAVGTGVLFGTTPALQAANPNLNETLRDAGARGSSPGRARKRLRSWLVIAEVALSLILVVGAVLLLRSFVNRQRVNPGFDMANLLTMRVALKGPSYDSMYKRVNFWDRALAALNARPGVVSAAIASRIPFDGGNNSFFNVEGQPATLARQPLLEIRWVSPAYLETLRIPLLRGRMFTEQEWADSGVAGRVAVVNEYMARRFWGSADAALGKRFDFGGTTDTVRIWNTVIGVAADIKHKRLAAGPDFQGYMPYRQGGWSMASIVIRTRGGPEQAAGAATGVLKAIDPLVPAYRVISMDANIAQSYWQPTLYSKLLSAFAAIALVLTAVGMYGVISYTVSQRTQEIGLRVALGAQRLDVLRIVVGHGAWLGAVGVAIGLAGALGVTRLLGTMLFGVSPFDPASFAGVSVGVMAIAALASYVPARRATRVDPMEALRHE